MLVQIQESLKLFQIFGWVWSKMSMATYLVHKTLKFAVLDSSEFWHGDRDLYEVERDRAGVFE